MQFNLFTACVCVKETLNKCVRVPLQPITGLMSCFFNGTIRRVTNQFIRHLPNVFHFHRHPLSERTPPPNHSGLHWLDLLHLQHWVIFSAYWGRTMCETLSDYSQNLQTPSIKRYMKNTSDVTENLCMPKNKEEHSLFISNHTDHTFFLCIETGKWRQIEGPCNA